MDEHTLTLLNGTKIPLYPLPHWDGFEEYIAIHRRRWVSFNEVERYSELMERHRQHQEELQQKAKEEQTEAKDILKANIKLLYDNAERILSDSRMFLALLPDMGGLAYVGTSVFKAPCLGAVLQWWQSCPMAHFAKNGTEYWVNQISGSPLSGQNFCSALTTDGEEHPISIPHFIELWSPLAKINRQYQGFSATCEHYTLKEVVEKLKSEK